MQKRQIDSLVHLQFVRLKRQFNKIEKAPDAETIKPFRIGIKKLRALLRLLSLERPSSKDLKLPGSLKKMHKSGGRVRDLELLEEKILEAINQRPEINYDKKALLEREERVAQKEEKEFLSLEEFSKAEKKIRQNLPDQLRTRTVKLFFRTKIEEAGLLAEKRSHHDKDLHSIRKKLKDILYILKLYREDLNTPLGFRFWPQKLLLKVKGLEEQLGHFNDICNALMLITPSFINKLKQPERKLIVFVKRKLLAEKRVMKDQVIQALSSLDLSFYPSLSLSE